MVNPERLHNAFAAIDILARADSVAFGQARGDAAPGTAEHTLQQIRQEGYSDAKKGLTPYCPYNGAERAAYKAGWIAGGGSVMFVKDSVRADATGDDAKAKFAEAERALKAGDHKAYDRLWDEATRMASQAQRRGDASDKDLYALIQRKLARGADITDEEQRVVDRMVGSTPTRKDAAPMSVREARKLGKEYAERANSRQRLMEVLRAEGADGNAMRAGLEAYDGA